MKPYSIREEKEMQKGKFYLSVIDGIHFSIRTTSGWLSSFGMVGKNNDRKHPFMINDDTITFEFDSLEELMANAIKCFECVEKMEVKNDI